MEEELDVQPFWLRNYPYTPNLVLHTLLTTLLAAAMGHEVESGPKRLSFVVLDRSFSRKQKPNDKKLDRFLLCLCSVSVLGASVALGPPSSR